MDMVVRPTLLLPILCLILVSYLQLVSAGGSMHLEFLRYVNKHRDGKRGGQKNGDCCDATFWGGCSSRCDHYFVICVDRINSPDTTTPCVYYKHKTQPVNNMDTINFRTDSGVDQLLKRPIPIPMNQLLRDVSIKIAVYDKDKASGDDDVDFLRLNLGSGANYVGVNNPRILTLKHRTILQVRVTFTCDRDWYGENCAVLCRPKKPGQYYNCDKVTGAKICDLGWTGPLCNQQQHQCTPQACENSGVCSYQGSSLHCDCSDEFTGPRCEIDYCDSRCKPGICHRVNTGKDGYRCRCPQGYHTRDSIDGAICELSTQTQTPPHVSTPQASTPGGLEDGQMPTPQAPPNTIDCDVIANNGYRDQDGTYNIELGPTRRKTLVYCDMDHEGGWTYLMHRGPPGTLSFHRNWEDYREGFGRAGPLSEHWVGLEAMHQLTKQRRYRLRVDMTKSNGVTAFAEYTDFSVGDERSGYTLHVSGYSGTAGDALGLSEYSASVRQNSHNNMRFSTYNQDNDNWPEGNCARDFKSGWWFNKCYTANLCGAYKDERDPYEPSKCRDDACIQWRTLRDYSEFSLHEVTMKILPFYH